MRIEDLVEAVPELPCQPSRALDIRKEECLRADLHGALVLWHKSFVALLTSPE